MIKCLEELESIVITAHNPYIEFVDARQALEHIIRERDFYKSKYIETLCSKCKLYSGFPPNKFCSHCGNESNEK